VRLSDYFGIDNVTLDAIPAKTVPEPATILLLGAGIAGLVGLREDILELVEMGRVAPPVA
jgi:hypothetical protein